MVSQPGSCPRAPVFGFANLAYGVDTVRELKALTGGLLRTYCCYPHRKSKPGNMPRGSATQAGNNNTGDRHAFQGALDTQGNQITCTYLIAGSDALEPIPHIVAEPLRLNGPRNFCEHGNSLNRVLPHS